MFLLTIPNLLSRHPHPQPSDNQALTESKDSTASGNCQRSAEGIPLECAAESE